MPIDSARRTSDQILRPPGRRADRVRAGKGLRIKVPRSAHARWEVPKERRDPLEILRASDRRRLSWLVPIRYGRMAVSPHAFLRGSAAVMASDLSQTPSTGLKVQLCGDAHLANFGVFATPERDQVFDISDFDETLPGPWEWDIQRLATSAVLAGRQIGLSRERSGRLATEATGAYRRYMLRLATRPYLEIWYRHFDLGHLPSVVRRCSEKELRRVVAKAEQRTQSEALPRLTERVRGQLRIRDDPPLLYHRRHRVSHANAEKFVQQYLSTLPDERRVLLERYHFSDAVEKTVGVGSVGTMCEAVLLVGDSDVEDPLFLQIKEADASVYEPYVGASPYANHAERVVTGQHLIQETSDIFLGWSRYEGRDFYVRQLQDMKGSADLGELTPKQLLGESLLCGAALARAHARSGDPAAIAGYLGNGPSFETAVTEFAIRYADQTERDHAELIRAIRAGSVHARDLP